MREPEKAPEDAREDEDRSAGPGEQPTPQGGKASTVPPDQRERCAPDTILEDGGAYLEPPD